MPQRATAKKMLLKEVLNASYHAGGSLEDPNYLEINGERIARVSVAGKVIEKKEVDESNYSSITVENDRERILVRFFGRNADVEVNDIVKVIGKTRENSEGRFILGEIAKKISEQELRLHGLESLAPSEPTEENSSFVQDAGSV